MRHLALASFALGLLFVAGCGSSSDSQEKGPSTAYVGGDKSTGSGGTSSGTPPSEGGGFADGSGGSAGPSTGGTTGSGTGTSPGQLTAGAWDDNVNFDFYLSYLKDHDTLAGAPKIVRSDRLRIDVSDGAGSVVSGAKVVVKAGDTLVFDGPTASDGHVDVYPTWAGVTSGAKLTIDASLGAISATAASTAGATSATVSLAGAKSTPPAALDIALMIDTTGSMSDEIAYLRSEVAAIAKDVAARWPAASQRWAVVAYKDVGDEYVVKTTPFASDMTTIQASINGLSAGGGGDYPESPEQALQATTTLEWRSGNVARMVFWIADAPHHAGKEGVVVDALSKLRGKGVHVYPIAASGADELTEYTMRTSAQVTLGRYLFLTDDSGIGGTHKEPTIPCYFVTKLDNAMRRMIATELTGVYVPPAADEILRVGGDPKDGRCTLSNGQQVTIY